MILDTELKRVLVRIAPSTPQFSDFTGALREAKPSWCSLGHSHFGHLEAQSCQTEARSPNCCPDRHTAPELNKHCRQQDSSA